MRNSTLGMQSIYIPFCRLWSLVGRQTSTGHGVSLAFYTRGGNRGDICPLDEHNTVMHAAANPNGIWRGNACPTHSQPQLDPRPAHSQGGGKGKGI